MEYFYREMRRRTGFLMTEDGKPEGGAWNYDKENRKALQDGLTFPGPSEFKPDAVTTKVIDLVNDRFCDHFGTTDGFSLATTRRQAERAARRFIDKALPHFGDYQDAMTDKDPHLFHSVISTYLNAGLLDAHG